jgi:CBS domain containing-hemolysin-like protein
MNTPNPTSQTPSHDAHEGDGKDASPSSGESPLERLKTWIGLKQAPTIRDDLEDALAEGGASDDFSPREKEMLKNVLALRGRRVDDVMVPRADIVSVSMDSSLGELLRMFRTAGHSRLPVHVDTLDDPRGMVHIRDFLDYLAARAETAPRSKRRNASADVPDLGRVDLTASLASAKILRPVLYAPPSMPALDLLVKMQTTRTHMALVIDEYGGTHGLVSIEDLVEIVVGDIEDEHDLADAPMITRNSDGTFSADARAPLEEVSAAIGIALADSEVAEDIDTLGGLIVTLIGRVPVRGEIIVSAGGLEYEVLDSDPRRIKRLRLHLRSGEEKPAESEAAAEAPAPPADKP